VRGSSLIEIGLHILAARASAEIMGATRIRHKFNHHDIYGSHSSDYYYNYNYSGRMTTNTKTCIITSLALSRSMY